MSRIIVALDRVNDVGEGLKWARRLRGAAVHAIKAHSLIDREGVGTVTAMCEEIALMADLKLHDIPATVADRAARYCDAGAAYLTVHASGGREMMRRAVEAGKGQPGILAISILTSLSSEEVKEIYGAFPNEKVVRFARMALEAGCHGLVCSGKELEALSEQDELASLKKVVPGIRLDEGTVAGDDQARVMTPERAVALGADYLVIGRPIIQADDPAAAAEQVNQRVEAALAK